MPWTVNLNSLADVGVALQEVSDRLEELLARPTAQVAPADLQDQIDDAVRRIGIQAQQGLDLDPIRAEIAAVRQRVEEIERRLQTGQVTFRYRNPPAP